jgi:hypothetical protein
MVDYPSTLPAPLISDFQESTPDFTIRTDMDAGVAKVRRRFSAAATPIQFTLLLTEPQAVTLDTFFRTTTAGGSLEFNMAHPRTGNTVTCRFSAPPAYALQGHRLYRVAMQMEILP